VNQILGAIATILAVTGVVLNNRKLIACFYLWLVSNAISGYLHYDASLHALLVRDILFSLLAIDGIYNWKTKRESKVVKFLANKIMQAKMCVVFAWRIIQNWRWGDNERW
jgi:nicotinamide riboside transporter PnuC